MRFEFLGTSSQGVHSISCYIFFFPRGYPQYQRGASPYSGGMGQLSVPNFEKGRSEKYECLGGT